MYDELAKDLNLSVEWVDSVVKDTPLIESSSETILEVINKLISKAQISEFGVESKPSVYELKLAVSGYINGNYSGHLETHEKMEILFQVLLSKESNKNLK